MSKRFLNHLRKSEGHLRSKAGDLRHELRRMENMFLERQRHSLWGYYLHAFMLPFPSTIPCGQTAPCLGRGEEVPLDTDIGGRRQFLAEMPPLQCPEAFKALLTGRQPSPQWEVRSPNLGPPASFGHGETWTQGSEVCLLAPQWL